jgi:hypothetical protein
MDEALLKRMVDLIEEARADDSGEVPRLAWSTGSPS